MDHNQHSSKEKRSPDIYCAYAILIKVLIINTACFLGTLQFLSTSEGRKIFYICQQEGKLYLVPRETLVFFCPESLDDFSLCRVKQKDTFFGFIKVLLPKGLFSPALLSHSCPFKFNSIHD